MFTLILSDNSGDIKANVMTEDAEDTYSCLEEGKVYVIDKPQIIMARKKFSNLDHDWEILFGKDTRLGGPLTTVDEDSSVSLVV
jgi:replication factor A1